VDFGTLYVTARISQLYQILSSTWSLWRHIGEVDVESDAFLITALDGGE